MRVLLTRLATASALALAACGQGPAAEPPGPPIVGMHASLRYFEEADMAALAAEVRASGATWVREDLGWDDVERTRGRFDWRRQDLLFDATARAGLTILPILNGIPAWTSTDGRNLPADVDGFARFAAAAVARYGPGGSFWDERPALAAHAPAWFELYNEPYLPGEDGAPPDPAHYAELVATAVTVARRENRRARFLLAGETYMTPDYATYEPWLEALYEAEPALGDYFDGLAAHPYGSGPPQAYDPERRDRSQTRRVEELDRILGEHGDGDKPIWITELGWSTCPAGDECVSEEQQARYLRDAFELLRTRWSGFVEALFVYHLDDYEPRADDDKEPWFGLRRPDGSHKPAFEVFRDYATRSR